MNQNPNGKVIVIALVGLFATVSSRADILLSQPFNNANTYYSMSLGGYPSVYDDFTLANGGSISTVKWSGIDPSTDITGFSINFFSDISGGPGTELNTTTLAGTAGATPSGSFNGPYPINNYSATLTSAFSAAAGTEYFIQISATAVGPGGFYWETSGVGDNGALSILFQSTTHLNTNLAFELDGAPVPEPTGAAFGLLAVTALLLRKFLTGKE